MGYIAIVGEGRSFWRRKFSSPDIIGVIEEAGYEGEFLHPGPNGTPFLRDKAIVYATLREAEAAGWEIIRARGKRSDPAYDQVTVYLRKKSLPDFKARLARADLDMSDFFQGKVDEYLNS